MSDPNIPAMVSQEAQAQGLDPSFVLSIAHQESNFNPKARSPAGALGVMQLMPQTAADLGVDPTDTAQNIHGGVKYIRQLSERYGGNPQLVAAAYNAGPSAVDRHGGVPPYAETQDYVAKVTGMASQPSPDDYTTAQLLKMAQTAVKAATPSDPTPESAQPQSQPSADDYTTEQLLQMAGYKPPTAPAAGPPSKASMLQQAANQNALAENPVTRGVLNAANGAIFGAEPFLRGTMAGAGVTLGNLAHGKLILSPSDMGGPNDPTAVARAVTQAEQKANETYFQQHPIASLATGLGGSLAGGGLIAGAEKGAASLAAKAAPSVMESGLARGALGAGVTGAAFGGQSGLETAEGGGSLGDIAAATGVGALSGAALHGVTAGAAPIISKIPTTAGRVLAGGALGAATGGALGGLTGQPVLATALAGAGGALGGRIGEAIGDRGSIVSPKVEDGVLAKVSDSDLQKLQAAPEGALAGEALGKRGEQLLARRSGEDPNLANRAQAAIDARNQDAPDRAAAQIAAATGIDPSTASADVQTQIEAQKNGPAKAAYDQALPGNPIWSPELAEQLQRPAVQKAYQNAKIEMQNLGMPAEVANPNYQPPPPVGRSNTGAAVISPEIHQAWMAEGTNNPARLLEMQQQANLQAAPAAARQPAMVPTDRALDLTKKYLDLNYDATNPAQRRVATQLGQNFRDTIDPLIPGYAQARALGGEYKQFGDAYQSGRDLFKTGANAETQAQFANRLSAMTPANQQAVKNGIAAMLHEGLSSSTDLAPKIATPRMQSILKTAFGEEQAKTITHAVKQQAYLKKSGGKLVASATPKDTSGNHSVLEGAVIGGADAGLHPLRMVEHIIGGAGTGAAARSLGPRLAKGFTTKAERAVLADLALTDAKTAAAKVAAAKARAKPKTLHDLSKLGVLSLAAPISNQVSSSLSDY